MIDTHAHLNFPEFQNDYQAVIQRSFENGITAIINVGSDWSMSERAVAIAKEQKNCWAAVGLHPLDVDKEKLQIDKYQDLISENRAVVKAVGETGLDYFYFGDDAIKNEQLIALQKENLINFLRLAKTLDLPVILHCRGSKKDPFDAYQDMLKILDTDDFGSDLAAVVHCFSSSWEMAKNFLNLGFYIGFTGPITFKNVNPELLMVVKNMPLDRILVETDCPLLAPEPHRGQRNEPMYVRYMIEKIAELKNLSFEEIDKITSDNARTVFGLK